MISHELRTVARFLLAGFANTAVGFAVFAGLWLLLGEALNPLAVLGLTYAIVSVPAFLLQRIFVFRSKAGAGRSVRRYYLISAAGIILNFSLLFLFTDLVGWDPLIGQTVSLVIIATVTFLTHRYWTFKDVAG